MGKQSLLSLEISRSRAWATAGVSTQEILQNFKKWKISLPKNHSIKDYHWIEGICQVLQESIPLGAPIGDLLKEIHPMIRREERLWSKLKSFEKQYGFQGAIAMVLPWVVVSLNGGVVFNVFTYIGIFLQSIGFFAFYKIARGLKLNHLDERSLIFDLLFGVWLRVVAGQSLSISLETVINASNLSGQKLNTYFLQSWKNWFVALQSGTLTERKFLWPKNMSMSEELSAMLASLVKTGAPCKDVLSDYMSQLDEEKQSLLEEKLTNIPVKLSLCFCVFFTPAFFLLLLGNLWPLLQNF